MEFLEDFTHIGFCFLIQEGANQPKKNPKKWNSKKKKVWISDHSKENTQREFFHGSPSRFFPSDLPIPEIFGIFWDFFLGLWCFSSFRTTRISWCSGETLGMLGIQNCLEKWDLKKDKSCFQRVQTLEKNEISFLKIRIPINEFSPLLQPPFIPAVPAGNGIYLAPNPSLNTSELPFFPSKIP